MGPREEREWSCRHLEPSVERQVRNDVGLNGAEKFERVCRSLALLRNAQFETVRRLRLLLVIRFTKCKQDESLTPDFRRKNFNGGAFDQLKSSFPASGVAPTSRALLLRNPGH